MNNLTFPIVCANLKSANAKVRNKVKPYQIFEKQGVAVIGVTTTETPGIANPDKATVFEDVVKVCQNRGLVFYSILIFDTVRSSCR